MTSLNELEFVDLIIGKDFKEIKGLKGEGDFISVLPDEYHDEADFLKKKCEDFFIENKRTEFSITHENRLYRITVITNEISGQTYIIRQTPKQTKKFNEIPFSTPLKKSIELPNATGLVLIAGEMGSGKTTTAAATMEYRVECSGCLGVAIEDPNETLLEGKHGTGRIFMLEVSGEETYSTAIKKAYRSGAQAFFLGEIRDSATATEVLRASLTMFVVSTIHASSVFDALERYVTFCEEINPGAAATIANTLYIIAFQRMRHNMRQSVIHSRTVEIIGYNIKKLKNNSSVVSKIKNKNFKSLSDDFNSVSADDYEL
jgi:twitching motility protein PilT